MKWPRLSYLISHVPPLLIDAALACVLGGVGAAQLVSRREPFEGPRRLPLGVPVPSGPRPPESFPFHSADTLTYLLLGLCAASLLLRRRFPLLALGCVALFGAAYLGRGEQPFSVQLIVLVAIYTAVADSSLGRVQAIGVAVGVGGLLGLALLYAGVSRDSSNWAMDAAWVLAAIFLGDSVRNRRAYEGESQRVREEEARRSVSEERLQIARELHDVVGHNISLISVQAGAGEHVLYADPVQAKAAFNNIRNTSHETLQELRSLVGVLRESSTGEPQTMPTQGLEGLNQLIKAVRDSGQEVELQLTGEPKALSSVVDLAAYRILQEALTNTVRHAAHAHVKVAVGYSDHEVTLEVLNGQGENVMPRQNGDGNGLAGMRERVAAIGGQIEAGPQPGGGYRVKAILHFE